MLLLFACSIHTSFAQVTVNIKKPFTDTLWCVKGNVTVQITPSDSMRPSNIFRIQLSDSNGSFSNPKQIGFKPGQFVTSVLCYIDSTVIAATGYRIRVVADSPQLNIGPYISSDNGVDIRISKFPEVTSSSNTPICVGDTLKLYSSTTAFYPTYQWSGPNSFYSTLNNTSKNNTSFADSGKYAIAVTSYGCTTIDSVRAIILPSPKIDSVGATTPICEEEDMKITMGCNICGQPGVQYRWYFPNGNIASYQPTLTYLNIIAADSGVYKLNITLSGCSVDTQVRVTVKPLPDTPVITSNSPLCEGETLKLNGSSSTSGVTYQWQDPNNSPIGTSNPLAIPNIQQSQQGEYKLYAFKNGCRSKAGKTDVKVGIALIPIPLTADTLLCPGDAMKIQAQTSVTTGIKWVKLPADTLVIFTGRTYGKSNASFEDSGTYVVTQEVNGCTSPPSSVTLNIPNIKNPTAKNNGPLCLGEKLEFSITPSNGASYQWTGPDNFASVDAMPFINNVQGKNAGIYNITTTLAHCTETDTTLVQIKPMPAITDITSNSPVCSYSLLQLNSASSIPGATFNWTGPNGFTSNDQNPSVYFEDNQSGTYSVTATVDGCTSPAASTDVVTKEGPGPTKVYSNSPIKEGETLELHAENSKPGVTFFWEGPDGFESDEANPKIIEATYRNDGIYDLTSIYNGCSTTVQISVDVKDILGITVTLYPNANDGKFTIEGITQTDAPLNIAIFNHLGKVVYRGDVVPDRSKFIKKIDLEGIIPSGVYILLLDTGNERKMVSFTVVRQ
ncbi:MAG: T9SS type A sorting domain-containing protein [Chitinophagales bacterium]|nr:T9SS type A sorting domain-containing protein [Chitinophagales bacterium]